ncbi:MAG: transposase [Acidaminococcus intestini]|uniref:Transposase n=1 Tax=Acidaminococcus intestini TaxID=187327 RepID=A0A943I4R8_9FIRM|nr:transposase [Acidaminococcus intestini]
MYLTQSNIIRGLSKEEYSILREMCRYSNNLYNVALYNIRQYYFQEKKFLKYEENYHVCKENENYSLLQAGVSQQTLKVADRSFKSFFNLIKKAKSGEYRFKDIKMPRYREKGGMFNLILSTNAINIKDGFLTIPMSREFSKLHGGRPIKIPFPERLEGKTIKEVRICPIHSGMYFKIQYCYLQEAEPQDVSADNVLAIDIGLENLATCVTSTGTAFIMDGRKLKSMNQYWNKQKAYYQSIADKQGQKKTHRLHALAKKRNHRTQDYIRKVTRYIINYCIAHRIGTIVCGYNGDFKRSMDLGKMTNQQFTQISFGSLRKTLEGLCERYGMTYIEQEESYTSKASCLDLDDIPVCHPGQPYTGAFRGKRVHRGLYQSADGRTINADVNGAANILRKSKQNFDFEELCRGLLDSPLRIRVS